MIQTMGELMAEYRSLGEVTAEENWIRCADRDGKGALYKECRSRGLYVNRNIKMLWTILETWLDVNELEQLKNECDIVCNESMIQNECRIEERHRPTGLNLNSKAIVIMARNNIPEDIKIGLSFGPKFLFPYTTTDDNVHSVLAQLDLCIEQSIPEIFRNETYKNISNILAKRSPLQQDGTIQWLCFVAMRSRRFFKTHKDIFATRSDKGGHTVIIEKEKYEQNLGEMLSDSNYEKLNEDPLTKLVEMESKLVKICDNNYQIKGTVNVSSWKFQPELLILAKFYGLPKVHKQNFSLRPILAMNGAPGYFSGKIFNEMLNVIFPRTHFHIKDSFEMKDFIDSVIIMDNDVLVSFDVVSMFTSIPRKLVREIILSKSSDFLNKFGMGKAILNKFLDFLLEESTIFTALGHVYRQEEGLPMGSCISPTLARITMDRVIEFLLINVPRISFIRVFVDDTITAINREDVQKALHVLNQFNPSIKFTCETENENKSIHFLNLTLYRDGNFITTNWYRKSFASGRLVNYLSSHKRTTVIGTAENFIKTVLSLSDGHFFQSNKKIVTETLRDNNFPETIVITLMNKFYTLMKPIEPSEKENLDEKYVIYPHSICESRKIKRILHGHKNPDIIYADSTKNTKINFVRTCKTFTPYLLRGNMVIVSKCQCGNKYKITSTGWNENAKIAIAKRMRTKFGRCMENRHAFKRMELHKGLAYKSQTDMLTRYVQWKYKGSFLNNEIGFPQFHFAKLLKGNRRERILR